MVLAELVTYLASQGIGTPAVNLTYGSMPSEPDACTTLYEYGGMPDETVLGQPFVPSLEYPKIQAKTRGAPNDYEGPRQKIQDIVGAFTKVVNNNLPGYKAILSLQPPFPLRRDENLRFEFVCNFQVTRDYSST
jgi:hypothetical protein